jgi:hypothetical protein
MLIKRISYEQEGLLQLRIVSSLVPYNKLVCQPSMLVATLCSQRLVFCFPARLHTRTVCPLEQ